VELRTLRPGEREAFLELLGGWEMGPPWTGRARAFFRRYVEHDPGFREADVHVAAAVEGRGAADAARDGGPSGARRARLLACVQLFPRRVRIAGGGELLLGGIGSVFTRPEARGRGLAGALLARAEADLRARGVPLGMLFAGPVDFYARRGWLPWPFARALYVREEGGGPGKAEAEAGDERGGGRRRAPSREGSAGGGRAVGPAGPEIHPFEPRRDLEAVRRMHAAYSADRPATLVRDTAAWQGSLAVAGNPEEDFRVARRGGAVSAYARHVQLEGHPVLAEFGRVAAPEAAGDLAALLDALLAKGAFGPAPADPALEAELARRSFGVRPLPDPSSMLRCLDPGALERALAEAPGASDAPGAARHRGAGGSAPAEKGSEATAAAGKNLEEALLRRLLPPERCLFWPADRF